MSTRYASVTTLRSCGSRPSSNSFFKIRFAFGESIKAENYEDEYPSTRQYTHPPPSRSPAAHTRTRAASSRGGSRSVRRAPSTTATCASSRCPRPSPCEVADLMKSVQHIFLSYDSYVHKTVVTAVRQHRSSDTAALLRTNLGPSGDCTPNGSRGKLFKRNTMVVITM